jgi:hypothetical protein
MRPQKEKVAKHLDDEIRQSAPEIQTHSFIVKVWIEEVATRSKAGKWRGRIIHVPGGEHCYLKNLRDIAHFITPYLKAMGIHPGIWEKLKGWLHG